jgi:hypothetical protein
MHLKRQWIIPVLLIAGRALAPAQTNAGDLVGRSLQADEASTRLARYYTYHEREATEELDGKGKVKSTETNTTEILFVGGKEYRRLIQKNDQPLKPGEERKETQKIDKAVSEASKLSQDQLNARYAAYEKKEAEDREQLKYLPVAFDFKLVGQEEVNGRPAYVITATPRADYHGKYHDMLSKLQGKLWIDKQDYHWAKFEADTLDTISFGLFLARLAKGTHIEVEQTLVNGELWLPKRVSFTGSARLALVKKFNVASEVTYSNYRKFQTDSKIVAISTEP